MKIKEVRYENEKKFIYNDFPCFSISFKSIQLWRYHVICDGRTRTIKSSQESLSLSLQLLFVLGLNGILRVMITIMPRWKSGTVKKESHDWKEALPLLRIQNEECIATFAPTKTTDDFWWIPPYGANNNRIDYVTPNMFAGSIFDLEPDTEYECKFLMSDPDGVSGYAPQDCNCAYPS